MRGTSSSRTVSSLLSILSIFFFFSSILSFSPSPIFLFSSFFSLPLFLSLLLPRLSTRWRQRRRWKGLSCPRSAEPPDKSRPQLQTSSALDSIDLSLSLHGSPSGWLRLKLRFISRADYYTRKQIFPNLTSWQARVAGSCRLGLKAIDVWRQHVLLISSSKALRWRGKSRWWEEAENTSRARKNYMYGAFWMH